MATRNKLYELIQEKLSDFFGKKKSWANLPSKVKDAAKKDPKIKKQLKQIEKDEEELEKSLDEVLGMDF
jgi:septal ring factor EnvC (AmiA/AmiB activator)